MRLRVARHHYRPSALWATYCRAIDAGQPEGDLGWEKFLQDLGPGPIDPERAQAPACRRRRGLKTLVLAGRFGGLRSRL